MSTGNRSSRRGFLRTAAAAGLGSLTPLGGAAAPTAAAQLPTVTAPGTNWAGNVRFSAKRLLRPEGREQLQHWVRQAETIRAVGGRHSFSDIADTDGTLLSLESLNEISVDRDARTVRVGAGVKYSDLCPVLESQGFAVENLASLPHICVVGACATATHGSGTGNLASVAVGLELIDGRGDLVHLTPADDDFNGAVVGLGGVGIVTHITLRIQPSFAVRQWVWENMPIDQYVQHFDEILAAGYSVSGFTTWRDSQVSEVWVKRLASDGDWNPGDRWFGATPAPRDRHPIVTMAPTPCTAQMGVAGPAWERLPHFRPDHPPSSQGRERHSEYMIDRQHAAEAITAMYTIGPQIAKALQISEIRTVNRDQLWMSTAYQRDCVCLHFTWTDNDADVAAAIPVVESVLTQFQPRPHWGKMHSLPRQHIEAQFPRINDFRDLCRRFDPDGKFHNAYLNRYVLAKMPKP